MYKLFGIKNCNTVKKAIDFLNDRNVKYEFIDFKKYTPTADDLQKWGEAFGGLPVNKQGLTYKKFKNEFEILSEKEKIIFISKNTSIIKRPILEKNGKVILFGFNEEEYSKI